jgi:hypothetical protein
MRLTDFVRRRLSESPEAWFIAASETPLARFAEGLRHYRALIETITTPWLMTAAMNLVRLLEWLSDEPKAETLHGAFAQLHAPTS